MTYQQIIETYLPLLQDLQTKVANHGSRRISMDVRIDGLGGGYVLADITETDEAGKNIISYIHLYFFDGHDKKELDDKICQLNAFFASKCITTITGVDSPISLN